MTTNDLYMQLLRAEFRTNHFHRRGDQKMVTFWSRVYYHLRRKVHALECVEQWSESYERVTLLRP